MKKYTYLVALTLALFVMSSDASALSSMKGMLGKGGSESSKDASMSADDLYIKFTAAQNSVLAAQEKLADAYGLKEESNKIRSSRTALSSRAVDKKVDLDVMNQSLEISSAVQAEIDKKINENAQLDSQGKKLYTEGVAAYVVAVKDAYLFLNAVKSFGTDTSSSGLLGKAKGAKTLIFVTKESPKYLKDFFNSTKNVFAFAKKQKIDVPKDATSMLDG